MDMLSAEDYDGNDKVDAPKNRYDLAGDYWRELRTRYRVLRQGSCPAHISAPDDDRVRDIAIALTHPTTRPLIAELLDGIVRRAVDRALAGRRKGREAA